MNITRVGYRFHPTDEELVNHFLRHKLLGYDFLVDDDIHAIDLCKFDPWQLPGFASQGSDDQVWYFFYKRELKSKNTATSSNSKPRYNRSTKSGHWKPTGAEREVRAKRTREVIGVKRTLVFYRHASPKEKKTNWVIHEYESKAASSHQVDLVLCKLKEKGDGSSGCDESEPSSNGASDFQNDPIEIPESEYDQGVLLDSILAAAHGVNFSHPSTQEPQQGISINDFRSPNEVTEYGYDRMEFQFDTSEVEEDPNVMADSFLDLEDVYGGENYIYALTRGDDEESPYADPNHILYLHDLEDMDSETIHAKSSKFGASSSNTPKEYRQTSRVQTLTELLPPSRSEQRGSKKNDVHRDNIVMMEASSADSPTCNVEEIMCIGLGVPRNEHKIQPRHSFSRSGALQLEKGGASRGREFQADFPVLTNHKAKETKKHVNVVVKPKPPQPKPPKFMRTTNESVIVKTEKDQKIISAKANSKLKRNEMKGDKAGSLLRQEISPLTQRPNPPSVYIFNLFIGFFLLIFACKELLTVHG